MQFSSTACLLRHERERHAMHGHGDKPHLCHFEGCERGVPGNGFPRSWNLGDHMKRVHNYQGKAKSDASVSPPPSAPVKGKKRKAVEAADTGLTVKMAKVVVAAAPVPVVVVEPKEPSLVERYAEQQLGLVELVRQMADPKCDEILFRKALDTFKVMAQTHKRIQHAPAMETKVEAQSG